MRARAFRQVDVFTAEPLRGNPVAVVLDGADLSDDEMQRFARWTNLSETTFVLRPDDAAADYRLRIFTPGGELPFAGHPTLGSCHAWLEAGGRPRSTQRIVQQCAQGLVQIRREGAARLAFAAPPSRRSAPSPTLLARVAGALGLKASQIVAAQLLDNGPVWLGLLLTDADTVLALTPDHRLLKELGQKVGVAGVPTVRPDRGAAGKPSGAGCVDAPAEPGAADGQPGHGSSVDGPAEPGAAGAQAGQGGVRHRSPVVADAEPVGLEVRAFAAPLGVEEDPVTGSLNASLAQWLVEAGHLPPRYLAAQGQALGRAGRVRVQRDVDGQVWIGGDSVSCIDGRVML